jgi:hypothetical protein
MMNTAMTREMERIPFEVLAIPVSGSANMGRRASHQENPTTRLEADWINPRTAATRVRSW